MNFQFCGPSSISLSLRILQNIDSSTTIATATNTKTSRTDRGRNISRDTLRKSALYMLCFLWILSGSCGEAFTIPRQTKPGAVVASEQPGTNRMVPQTKPFSPETLPNWFHSEDDDSFLISTDHEKTLETLSTIETVMETEAAPSQGKSNDSQDDSETPESNEESTPPETRDEAEETTSSTDNETISNRQGTLYRAGLLKKNGSERVNTEKKTSVGDRRTGSASRARQGVRRTTQLVDAVRQRAQGIAGGGTKSKKSMPGNPTDPENPADNTTKSRLSTARIHSTVEELIRKKRNNTTKRSQADRFTAAISHWGKSMGILGDEGGQPITQVLSESPTLVTRVASPMDDVDIANLRLSVFSDFSPEMQSQFCFRSCQALAHRRTHGAICVVATPPPQKVRPVLLGSAECSYHEFKSTRLGQRRPQGSLLYITEVAVHPSARRQGIGVKLLESMDVLAAQKGIETLFLHVDVSNHVALALYEKCGYQRTDEKDPIYREFTTSLNLHPGATRGRTHHLLYKNIRVPTWVKEQVHEDETQVMGSLGFEIPA
eukprot:scaffold2536_cov169-Amphora_coffeaeformis.AAC.24